MIQRLSFDVIKKIKSDSEISDLDECIIQLIYNSIDAQASLIKVKVNFEDLNIIICDNGVGMTKKDLELIGECNVTSKLPFIENLGSHRSTFGFHGEALFNIIQLSRKVEIVTRDNKSSTNFHFKEFNQTISNSIKTFESSYPDQEFNTLILIEKLFYNHALRSKQLSCLVKRLKCLLTRLEYLSLIHFKIKIVLEDFSDQKLLFFSPSSGSLRSKFVEMFALNIEFVKSYSSQETGYQIEASINVPNIQNRSLNILTSTSRVQFIFINSCFLIDRKAYEIVSKELSYCKNFNISKSEPCQMIFCLSVTCPKLDYTVLQNNKRIEIVFKQHISIESILRNFVNRFLCNYGYVKYSEPKNSVLLNKSDSLIKDYGVEINAEDLKFSRLSKMIRKTKILNFRNVRIKKKKSLAHETRPKIQLENPLKLYWTDRLFNQQFKMKYSDLELGKRQTVQNIIKKVNKSTQTEVNLECKLKINWILQKTDLGTEFYLNFIDGYTTYDINEAIESQVTKPYSQLTTNFSKDFDEALLLTNNFNPRSREERQLNNEKNEQESSNDKIKMNNLLLEKNILIKWRNKEEFDELFSENKENFDQFGSKIINHSIFEHLKVIGQLDKKFIIASVSTIVKSSRQMDSFIIFDQHACHERIRLEKIYKENIDECGNLKKVNIAEPLNLEIQGISDEVFDRFKNQMANFGVDLILCSTKNNPEKKTLSILKINSLPNIIVKKKNSDLNIKLFIHNLLNNQLKSFNSNSIAPRVDRADVNAFSLINLPIEIVELFNMEACRGAIKFGDYLTNFQCESMILELSKCRLPFQCAHGRPSVVPLTNIFKNAVIIFLANYRLKGLKRRNKFILYIEGTQEEI